MKHFMKKILAAAAVLTMLLLLLPLAPARAGGPLDEIKNYTVTVDPRRDGTLDIKYHIDWLVLDSTSEGPLTWVKIGIANSHADELKALSGTIKGIGYLSDSGSWVRLDLDRAYEAGETVSLDFSLHQSYMYRLDGEKNDCSFTFVPGWFDEITVDSMKLLWNKADVTYSNSTGTEGNYFVWSTALEPGKRCTAIVRYSGSTFSTNEGMQAYDENTVNENAKNNAAASGAFLVIFIIVIVVIAIAAAGGNNYRGGFGGRGGGMFIAGGGGHSCACAASCACACACACAGGGRAGCSAKNFYGTKAETEQLRKILKK